VTREVVRRLDDLTYVARGTCSYNVQDTARHTYMSAPCCGNVRTLSRMTSLTHPIEVADLQSEWHRAPSPYRFGAGLAARNTCGLQGCNLSAYTSAPNFGHLRLMRSFKLCIRLCLTILDSARFRPSRSGGCTHSRRVSSRFWPTGQGKQASCMVMTCTGPAPSAG